MKRIKSLDRYQKGILIVLAAMIVVFCGVYAYVTSQFGYIYKDTLLKPSQQDGNTVYSGKMDWQDAEITVTADKEITFLLGNKVYGPYTVKEDPTAKPTDHPLSTGFEIKKGDEILFRGGAYRLTSDLTPWNLYNEDGTPYKSKTSGIGQLNNEDKYAPAFSTLLTLYHGPELTHKGDWRFYALCVFLSIVISAFVIFAEELFRWRLRRQTSDWRFAEPSEWEITSRYISMTLMTALILFLYIKGLQ